MSIQIQDAAVAAALDHAIGRVGPYSETELASVRELRIVGASSLDELVRCTGLERLAIIGSDLTDLRGLSHLKLLQRLHVLGCPVANADGLVGLDRLEELRLDFAFLEDASPLFALPSLRTARLVGHAWNESSWDRLQQHALPPAGGGPARRPVFDLGGESPTILEANRRFRAFGLELCSGALDAFRVVLVRPGKARVAGLEFDWSATDSSGGWLRKKGDWTTDKRFEASRAARGEQLVFDFESHREYGDRDDALRWIDAERDELRRSRLRRFIGRFPGAVFFREDDVLQAAAERRAGVALPASYREARTILAGACKIAPFRVSIETGPDRVPGEEVWFSPQFEDYTSEESPTIRDVARLYPFARCSDRSSLAVSLDGDQPDIFIFGEDSMFHEIRQGNSADSAVHAAYSSYADLLGNIVAFKLPGDLVLEAADGHR
jgi:hypothetical protein